MARYRLRAEVPDRRRILDQESEAVRIQQRQSTGSIGPDRIPHPWYRTDRPRASEPGRGAAFAWRNFSISSIHSCCIRRARRARYSRNCLRDAGRSGWSEELDRIEAGSIAKLGANVGVHRREACRVGYPFQGLEVQLRQVHAVPIELARRAASIPAATRRKQSRLARFINLRQSSCASCRIAVCSRHSG